MSEAELRALEVVSRYNYAAVSAELDISLYNKQVMCKEKNAKNMMKETKKSEESKLPYTRTSR